MIIHLKKNIRLDVTLPIGPVSGFTSSALPLEFVDIPGEICGAAVVAVAVTVTNADGVAATAPCEHADGVWRVIFAASCFEHYGYVESGVSVALTLRDGSGNERRMVLAVGDLEVKRSSPSAAPGDPEKSYQIKGEDIFVKTRVIDDVQHYTRQEMSYDAEMGAWGADWLGDYILVDGEFVPFQAAGGTAATVATALLALLLVPFSAFGITATKEYVDRKDGEVAALSTNIVTSATNALAQAVRDYDGLSNKPQINGVSLSGNKTGEDLGVLDLAGGTMTGGIRLGAQGAYGYLGLAYDGENHRLVITDGWHENFAYLEVPNAYDSDRVAFTHDIPDVPAWALAAQKPTYTADEVGAYSTNETMNIVSAAISPTSPAFSNAVLSVGLGIDTNTVAVINELVDSAHDLPVSGATSVGALLLALAAAVAALKKNLRYSYNTATVSSGTTPTVTDVADRAINTATLGSSVTAATVTLPAATANRARDFFIDLTIEATTAPTLTFIDPATNTTANVTFGADSLADIDTGKNAVLFTEFPNYTWIVSVKHEEMTA
jgi:hypothetical protein